MVHLDGHEVAVFGTVTGFYAIANATLRPGWIKSFIHRQPVPAFSMALFGLAMIMPVTIVPLRRMLKLPTHQHDAGIRPNVVYPKYADVYQL